MADGRARFETEFGRYTSWLVEAVAAVGLRDPIPAVCRGTGHPALLEDLADAIGARAGMLVLDAGCGMGGPSAWLRRERACNTVGIDLMEQNVRAARDLFGETASLVASAGELPFGDATFDAIWAVGVMEMIDDKPGALREANRVLKPHGRMAVYSFTSRETDLPDPPQSDTFTSPEDLSSLIAAAGLTVLDAHPTPAVPPLPEEWVAARAAVQQELRAQHGDDEEFSKVRSELERFNRLRAAGRIVPWRFELAKEVR